VSVASEKLEQAIRDLPVEQMVLVHEHLIMTIHDKADTQGLDPAFREEIEQRIKDIDAGNAKGVNAFRALRTM